MAFCTECGTQVDDGVRFCTSCGGLMGEGAGSAPAQPAQPAPPPPRPPAHAAPRPAPGFADPDAPPPPGSRYAVMSMGAYIGTMILFAIPVVGWLACIIMAFAARKLNRRNLARAMLVFLIAGAVVGVALYFVFNWAANAVLEYLYEATGIVPGDLEGLGGLLDMIKGMN